MTDARHLMISVDERGMGSVVVDGEDVSNAVTELIVVVRPGAPARGTTVVTTDKAGKVEVQVGTKVGIMAQDAQTVVALRPADERAMLALGWRPPGSREMDVDKLVEGLEVGDRVEILREEGGLNVAQERGSALLRTEVPRGQ